jgi:hypothetical protein
LHPVNPHFFLLGTGAGFGGSPTAAGTGPTGGAGGCSASSWLWCRARTSSAPVPAARDSSEFVQGTTRRSLPTQLTLPVASTRPAIPRTAVVATPTCPSCPRQIRRLGVGGRSSGGRRPALRRVGEDGTEGDAEAGARAGAGWAPSMVVNTELGRGTCMGRSLASRRRDLRRRRMRIWRR